MCVLYASFGPKVTPRTFVYVAMSSAVLFILRSRLLLYSAGSGVNRVQVVLSGFDVRLLPRACVCGCDGDVICLRHDLNRSSGWW